MAIGTRRKGPRGARVLLMLPSSLALRIEVLPGLYDRFHQSTIYGARAQLFTSLLQEWIKDPSEEDLLEVLAPRRRPGAKTKWILIIPTELNEKLNAIPGFPDSFGSYSRLATLLLTRWVTEQEKKILASQPTKEPSHVPGHSSSFCSAGLDGLE